MSSLRIADSGRELHVSLHHRCAGLPDGAAQRAKGHIGAARARGDLGASAVELAIITAVILGIAVALLAVIKTFVSSESSQIHG